MANGSFIGKKNVELNVTLETRSILFQHTVMLWSEGAQRAACESPVYIVFT